MKAHIFFTLFILLITINTKAQGIKFEDLKHPNKGCLENSICSKHNGLMINKWRKLKDKKTQKIEQFRQIEGLPIQFLTKKENFLSLDPVAFKSRCKQHNSKNTNQQIFKAITFLRNNPKSNKLIFTKVLRRKKNISYEIPYGEQPLLLKDNKVFFVRDFEDIYFNMSVSQDGMWKVENLDSKIIKSAILYKEPSKCKRMLNNNEYFSSSYCLNIWNTNTKKTEQIEVSWSCP